VKRRGVGTHFDWQRLRDHVLIPVSRGAAASYLRFDWALKTLSSTAGIAPRRVVLVEGVTCARLELARYYDLFIWVDCPRELRLSRGLARDGASARDRWEREWMPAEDRYVREHRPRERADLVVLGAA
jgi:uridine kinase